MKIWLARGGASIVGKGVGRVIHCRMSCYGQDGTKKRVRAPTLPAATLGGDRSFGMNHTMDQVPLVPPAWLMNGYYMEVKPRRPSSGGETGPAPASRGAKCQLGRLASVGPEKRWLQASTRARAHYM